MGQRPYLRGLTHLSKPLLAAIALGTLAALTWVVGVSLSVFWDINVDELALVLGALVVGAVISVGVELNRSTNRWVRGIGVLLIVAAVGTVLAVLLILWYVSLLCGNGCN